MIPWPGHVMANELARRTNWSMSRFPRFWAIARVYVEDIDSKRGKAWKWWKRSEISREIEAGAVVWDMVSD